jgi:hypothetical protein
MTRKIKVTGNAISEASITHLSLVKRGANRTRFAVIKAENALAREVPIAKADDERHLAYGAVYVPNVPDSHNDWMSADEIEKAAHRFLASGAVNNVDHEHDLKNTGSVVVESFIARDGDADFPVGAWVVGVHVPSPDLWRMVKSGEITGFSMFGQGIKTPATIEIEKSALVNRNLERAMSSMKKSMPPSGNYMEPGTPGEEAAANAGDGAGAKNATEAARVARQRAYERRVVGLKSEIEQIKYGSGDPHNKQRVVGELLVEVAALERAIIDENGGEVRKSALDLLVDRGDVNGGFATRGGQSFKVDAGAALPSELSKAEQQFEDDLRSDALGVRRAKDRIVKGGVEIMLSNPFGLRRQ